MNPFRTIAPAVAGITLRGRAGAAILPSTASFGIDKPAACAMAALQGVHHDHSPVCATTRSTPDDAGRGNHRRGQASAALPGAARRRTSARA
jgi:hypothetical protein